LNWFEAAPPAAADEILDGSGGGRAMLQQKIWFYQSLLAREDICTPSRKKQKMNPTGMRNYSLLFLFSIISRS
jgi:hypothetical protein